MEIFLHVIGSLKTKKSFPICTFVVMVSGKYDLHIHFTFFKNSNLHTYERIYKFFRVIYAAMSNNQLLALDNIKMTCETLKY